MMPRRNVLIISIAAVVLLGGGVALLALLPQPEIDDETSPAPAVTSEVFSVIYELEEDVTSVEFTPADGHAYTLVRGETDDGTASYTLKTDAETLFPPLKTEMSTSFQSAINIPNATLVTENPDGAQLELFGLDKPYTTVRVNLTDGYSETLELGAVSAVNSGRYVRKSGDNTVYILTNYYTSQLTKELEKFNNYAFLPDDVTPATDDNPTYYAFASVTLTRGDTVLQVARDAVAGEDFKMVQPFEVDANLYTLPDEFLIPMTNIKPSVLVEEHPQDLSQYGLDAPSVLELVGADGWQLTLLIGNYDSGLGGRFVMMNGIDSVLLDKSDAYLFLEATASRLRTGLAWATNIASVTSVEFYLDGKTRKVEYEHFEDNKLTARLDGVDLTEDNGRRLYSSMLSVTVNGDCDEEIPDSEPDYKFTINYVDGTSGEMKLYKLNDRQYLMELDGVNLRSFTYVTTLREKLLDKFDMLDRGEELPHF